MMHYYQRIHSLSAPMISILARLMGKFSLVIIIIALLNIEVRKGKEQEMSIRLNASHYRSFAILCRRRRVPFKRHSRSSKITNFPILSLSHINTGS